MAIITISRGTYSYGSSLARCLAERLGYECLSREVVLDAATGYGIPAEKLTSAMEKPPSFWQQLTGERIDYLHYVRAALCERAKDGNLVYHGHAGHLLLAGISHVIRVRVIADIDHRIQAAMRDQGLGRKEAIDYIKKVDQQRVRWTRFLYGVDWHDASLYDIVLNLAHMRVTSACEILARMTELDDFKPTPQSLRAIDDLAISSRVWAALSRDLRTRAADLRVTADDGVVTVTGTTRSWAVVEAIPEVAGAIEGVKEVKCEVGIGSVYDPVRKPAGTRLW